MSYMSTARTTLRGLGLLLIAALVLPSVALAQEAPIKIAVVDLELIVTQSESGKALQKKLEEFAQSVQTEGEAKAKAYQDLQLRLRDGANSLADDKLSDLQKQVEDAEIDLKRFQRDKEREGQKIQAEGLREIEKQLKPIFDSVREEQGYDLILNDVPGVVVMATPRIDITNMIIERFNASTAAGG